MKSGENQAQASGGPFPVESHRTHFFQQNVVMSEMSPIREIN